MRPEQLATRFMVNVWGFDEDVMREAGTAADGVVWVMGATHWNASGPGMYTIRQVSMMSDPEQTKYRSVHYIRVSARCSILKKPLKSQPSKGEISAVHKSRHVRKGKLGPRGPRRRLPPRNLAS